MKEFNTLFQSSFPQKSPTQNFLRPSVHFTLGLAYYGNIYNIKKSFIMCGFSFIQLKLDLVWLQKHYL